MDMPKTALENVLVALADPTRRQALRLLHATDELCVCELMKKLGASQSRMSRHMSALKAAGLALDRRDAQWVRYRRNPHVPAPIAAVVNSILAASGSETVGRSTRRYPRRGREGAAT
jgi:ArsR family transcriptional regulator